MVRGEQQVLIEDKSSEAWSVDCGLPHGTVLSPVFVLHEYFPSESCITS